MTSVQQAREALGGRLREVRRRSGLTGAALAEQLGWPHSKVSKLENGRQTPSDPDIRNWCSVCGDEGEREQEGLLAALHTLESRHAEWRRVLKGGARGHPDEIASLHTATRLFHVFETAGIPGLLQIEPYIRSVFAKVISIHGVPNDIDAAVAARIARQQVLYDPGKRFHFVITEAALRYRLAPPDVMLAQLDRLVAATTLSGVRLGVIANRTAYVAIPAHGFWLLDDKLVMVETFSAELNLAQPPEIEVYSAAFGRLAGIASYGRGARSIITAVMDDLRTELGDEDSETSMPE